MLLWLIAVAFVADVVVGTDADNLRNCRWHLSFVFTK
jgi:hypothetical protein